MQRASTLEGRFEAREFASSVRAITASSSDKWGRRLTLTGMTFCCDVFPLAYMHVLGDPCLIQFLGFVIGFFVSGALVLNGPFLSDFFRLKGAQKCNVNPAELGARANVSEEIIDSLSGASVTGRL